MALRRSELLDIRIEKMANGGNGIARHEGMVVFVPGSVSGDTVRVMVSRKKKEYAEARIIEILAPSPLRINPSCPHAEFCGGCQWQHIDYDAQLSFKQDIVKECVERIGGLIGTPVHPVIPSPKEFRYRNKMEFSFSDRRWVPRLDKPLSEFPFTLGLHVPGTFNKVIDIEECLLLPEEGSEILRSAKALLQDTSVPVYGLKSHSGYWRFLTLRYSAVSKGWLVNIITSDEKRGVLPAVAERLCKEFPSISGFVHTVNSRKAAIAAGEKESSLMGQGFLLDTIGPWKFRISASSFFQTNSLGASRLYDTIAKFAALRGSEQVLDLYSGTGTIPIYLSKEALAVTGMELNEQAVMDARVNCEINGVQNCSFIVGDIRELLKEGKATAEVVVADPPRSGMHKDVTENLLETAPGRIVYVSCNPATLARDLALLSKGYEICEIQPVDMFPHTHHVESVARLEKKGR